MPMLEDIFEAPFEADGLKGDFIKRAKRANMQEAWTQHRGPRGGTYWLKDGDRESKTYRKPAEPDGESHSPSAAPSTTPAAAVMERPAAASTDIQSFAETLGEPSTVRDDGDGQMVLDKINQATGASWTLQDVAKLCGAMEGAQVFAKDVTLSDAPRLRMDIIGTNYTAECYLLVRDGEPKLILGEIAVEKDQQGKGIGTKLHAQIVAAAERMGIRRILLEAARSSEMNGYYTWPLLGYDAELGLARWLKRAAGYGPIIREKPESITRNIQAAADRMGLPKDVPFRLSDLMRSRDGQEIWKRYGDSMSCEFDTRAGSLSRRVFDAYLAKRFPQLMAAESWAELMDIDETAKAIGPDADLSADDEALLRQIWVELGIVEEAGGRRRLSETTPWRRVQVVENAFDPHYILTREQGIIQEDWTQHRGPRGGTYWLKDGDPASKTYRRPGTEDQSGDVTVDVPATQAGVSSGGSVASGKRQQSLFGQEPKRERPPARSQAELETRYARVADLYRQDAGVSEGYTIGEHTGMVMAMWDRKTRPDELEAISGRLGVDVPRLMQTTLMLHDIGKPLAIEEGEKWRQHEFTLPIMADVMQQEGFGPREIQLAQAIVGHDIFGDVLKGRMEPSDGAAQLIGKAEQAGVDPVAFSELAALYFTADAASYPYMYQKVFLEVEGGRLEFKSPAYLELMDEVVARSRPAEPEPVSKPESQSQDIPRGSEAIQQHVASWTDEQKQQDWKANGTRGGSFKSFFGDWEHDLENCSKVLDQETGEPKETAEISGEGSKVTDEDGLPKVVYHGTVRGGFADFDPTKMKDHDGLLYGPGFYFTEDPEIASEYAGKKVWNISDSLETREEAERMLAEKAQEWTERYGGKMEEFQLGVREDGVGWRVYGEGYDRWSEKVLDREVNAADIGRLRDIWRGEMEQAELDGNDDEVTRARIRYLAAAKAIDTIKEGGAWQNNERVQWVWQHLSGTLPGDERLREQLGITLVERPVKSETKAVYLNIRNPMDVDKVYPPELVQRFCDAMELRPNLREALAWKQDGRTGDELVQTMYNAGYGKQRVQEALVALGFDGITHIGGRIVGHKDHRVWIAFEPTQIKAKDNQGTFDTTKANMYESWLARYGTRVALEEWTRYEGPRGGKGWQWNGQGDPRYQDEMPGALDRMAAGPQFRAENPESSQDQAGVEPVSEPDGGGSNRLRKDDPSSPAFKEWFGASKIVTSSGSPREVYTGQPRGITEFTGVERSEFPVGVGFFTTDREVASQYAGSHPSERGWKRRIPYDEYGTRDWPYSDKHERMIADAAGVASTDDIVDMTPDEYDDFVRRVVPERELPIETGGKEHDYSLGKSGRTYRVYLKMEKPWRLDRFDSDEWREAILQDAGYDPSGDDSADDIVAEALGLRSTYDEYAERSFWEDRDGNQFEDLDDLQPIIEALWAARSGSGDYLQNALDESPSGMALVILPDAGKRIIANHGYDGLTFPDSEMGGTTLVPFDGTHVKLSRGNAGTYKKDSTNIAEEWTPYRGPKGGTGWQKDGQGKPRYQKEKPGDAEEGQKRARNIYRGGEIGPKGEWYRPGAFIATTELPKMALARLHKAASGKVQVEPYRWVVPEPGKMAIISVASLGPIAGAIMRNNPDEVRDVSLAALGIDRGLVEDMAARYAAGERWLDVAEFPELMNFADAMRLVKAGKALPAGCRWTRADVAERLGGDVSRLPGEDLDVPEQGGNEPAPSAELRPVGKVFSDGTAFQMDVANDRFVHFTTRQRAEQILQSGKLLMDPPYRKFGTDSVDAVSLTYGKFLPGVQTSHIEGEDLVAVVFRTTATPEIGYAEEVKWHRDVPLLEPQIVSAEEAKSLLNRSQPIGDSDQVVYSDEAAARYREPADGFERLKASGLQPESRGSRTVVKAEIPMPPQVKTLAAALKLDDNAKLYAVGGAVRDFLMNRLHDPDQPYRPKDVDLTTNLSEAEILERLSSPEAAALGIKVKAKESLDTFGVVFANVNGVDFEVAPFRQDIGTADGRRPERVERGTMEQDAARRDLTMNNLYYDFGKGEILDLNPDGQGLRDIAERVTRPVGDPSLRFEEDRLRVLRLVRFFSRFNEGDIRYFLDEPTRAAVEKYRQLPGVTPERIETEFAAGLQKARDPASYLQNYQRLGLLDRTLAGLRVNPEGLERVGATRDRATVLAYLLRDEPQVRSGLNRLRYSNDISQRTQFLVDAMNMSPDDAPRVVRSKEQMRLAPNAALAGGVPISPERIEARNRHLDEEVRGQLLALAEMVPEREAAIRLRHLAVYRPPKISGDELAAQGFAGPDIGREQRRRVEQHYRESLEAFRTSRRLAESRRITNP